MVFKKLIKIFRKTFSRKKRLKKRRQRIEKRSTVKRRSLKIKASRNKLKSRSRKGSKRRFAGKSKKRARVSKQRIGKAAKKPKTALPAPIGVITHYFPRVNAAVVRLKRPIRLGIPILIKGKSTNFRQTVSSIQINRNPIESARAGAEIGLEVFKGVKPGDLVYESS